MTQINVWKISTAFLGGAVIALLGTLLYVRPGAPESPPAPSLSSSSAPPIAAAPQSAPVFSEVVAVPLPAPRPARLLVKRTPGASRPLPPPPTVEDFSVPEAQALDRLPLSQIPSAPAAGESVSTAQPAAPESPHTVTLQAGTQLAVRLAQTLSTAKFVRGDVFDGTLEEPIIRETFIIADKGSHVVGRVVDAERAGRVRGTALLRLTLTGINTTDGQNVTVETSEYEQQGETSRGADAGKVAAAAGIGAAIGAIAGGGKGAAIGAGAGAAGGTGVVLATRGKDVTIGSETSLAFRLTSPVTITERINH